MGAGVLQIPAHCGHRGHQPHSWSRAQPTITPLRGAQAWAHRWRRARANRDIWAIAWESDRADDSPRACDIRPGAKAGNRARHGGEHQVQREHREKLHPLYHGWGWAALYGLCVTYLLPLSPACPKMSVCLYLYTYLEKFGCPESYASTITTTEVVPLTLKVQEVAMWCVWAAHAVSKPTEHPALTPTVSPLAPSSIFTTLLIVIFLSVHPPPEPPPVLPFSKPFAVPWYQPTSNLFSSS